MTKFSMARPFTDALEDLEKLADTRATLNARDYSSLDASISREIQTMKKVLPSTFWGTFDKLVETRQRVVAVRSKLIERRSDWDRLGLDNIVAQFTSHEIEQKTKSVLKEAPTRLVPRTIKSWSIPVASVTSKTHHWHQKDYQAALIFAFDAAKTGQFRVEDGKCIWEVLTHTNSTPFVALSTSGDPPRVRLIPAIPGSNVQSEVIDIELPKIQDAHILIGHLLEMGYSVIQRPVG
ncbi:MAG: hypothetical protein Q9226_003984, partial [Calogaya cf. arnoldii]